MVEIGALEDVGLRFGQLGDGPPQALGLFPSLGHSIRSRGQLVNIRGVEGVDNGTLLAKVIDARVASDGENPGGNGRSALVVPVGVAPNPQHDLLNQVVAHPGLKSLSVEETGESGRESSEEDREGRPVLFRGDAANQLSVAGRWEHIAQ